ncbi:MAG: type II secretion system protein [Candidatus Pacebacteria bacterium]|nr:type II secretion system protein [Candidatus Paceibacterota bacterium]
MKKFSQSKNFLNGFTLIELLVVMAVIGIMAGTILIVSKDGVNRARDARRISEAFQIINALKLYSVAYGIYPVSTDADDPDCLIHGIQWDRGNELDPADEFLKVLETDKFLTPTPKERYIKSGECTTRYAKVVNPCDGQCLGSYGIFYAACEGDQCPVNERPACCAGSTWAEGSGDEDKSDIIVFLKDD